MSVEVVIILVAIPVWLILYFISEYIADKNQEKIEKLDEHHKWFK